MSTSIFIAKLLGPVFVAVGIAIPLRAQAFRDLLREFIHSAALLYLAGFFGLLGGLALVLTHNVWVLDWRLIITLIGWITIVRALVTVFYPQVIVTAGSKLLEYPVVFYSAAAVNLLIGLVLSYFGYLA